MQRFHQDESGFGLVQLMVAMVLFAIILTAAAPVLVNSLRQAGTNVATAAAAQLANEQIAAARLSAGSCAQFENFINTPVPNVTTGRNTFVVSLDSQILDTGERAACDDRSHPTMWMEVNVALQSNPGTTVTTTRTVVSVPGLK